MEEEIFIDGREHEADKPSGKKPGLGARIKAFFKNPKKRLVFIIVLGLIIVAAAAAGYYFFMRNTDKVAIDSTAKPEPTYYESPLDGIMTTDVNVASRHPLGIIVENHVDARPQAGLTEASIVYEAIAEGGITRFLALFGTKESEKVGPVRSARTYYVDWAHGYNAYLGHVGGNIDALDQIKSEKILDLDQFAYPKAYWREKGLRVSSEHTMFTTTAGLREQAAANGYPTENNFPVYKFKDDPKADSPEAAVMPASQTISVNFGSANYNVSFAYDKASNSYLRSQAGKTHTDKTSGAQINPKNVIVMTVTRQAIKTRINETGYQMTTVGEGAAKIFLDGKVIDGTWKKTSKENREKFYDATGAEIIFNRGQFWISVIPPDLSVSVQ